MSRWPEYSPASIRRRYNILARFYPLFEIVFWLPPGSRARAVARLGAPVGGRVLEVGCGTGRNFAYLVRAIGPAGHVYGIDASDGMLAQAQAECTRRGWANVTLLRAEADAYELPEQVDGVLFSLSYSVIPQHRAALREAWRHLRPGGRLVILDGKLPSGILGRLLRPGAVALSRATILGDPDRRPWEDLRELTDRIEVEELQFGTYYLCRATKRGIAGDP